MSVTSIFTWAANNWTQLLGLVALVIASASVVIKALEAIVKALLVFFPKLAGVDGKLLGIAAWLDALAKSGWLNTAAASPQAAKSPSVAAK